MLEKKLISKKVHNICIEQGCNNMFKRRVVMYGSVFVSQMVLSILLDDPVMAGLIVMGVFVPCYVAISVGRHMRRIALLDEACDPEAFISATQKQHDITGKNKRFSNYLRLDLSAGLATAGRFEETLFILDGLDEGLFRKKQIFRNAVNNNRYVALRGLGRDGEADLLFEESISSVQSHHKVIKIAINMARCDYEYHQKNYEACHTQIALLKQMSLSKRHRLYLCMTEGRLALEKGALDIATEHFEKVVSDGSKLYIAREAENYLMRLKDIWVKG